MAANRPILVILGPTAGGKSALAMEVARRTGAQILSVDSMQVYRGMDIGTAKPTSSDRAQVPHHLIDVVNPDESFAVARFVELADAIIADTGARNVPLIATGGTPMYYKALFTGLFAGPGADEAIRQRLRALPSQQLHRRLAEVDPVAAGRIHVNDLKRLVRALEVFEMTGRPISSFQTAWDQPASRHPAIWVGLHWERPTLNRRINARVRQMVTDGWIDETRRLLARHGALSPTAAEATGYRQWTDHLAGRITRDDALESIKIATRQLAGRQIKWFRRFPELTWLSGQTPPEQNAAIAIDLWRS